MSVIVKFLSDRTNENELQNEKIATGSVEKTNEKITQEAIFWQEYGCGTIARFADTLQ